jgi:hypothetical protein
MTHVFGETVQSLRLRPCIASLLRNHRPELWAPHVAEISRKCRNQSPRPREAGERVRVRGNRNSLDEEDYPRNGSLRVIQLQRLTLPECPLTLPSPPVGER